METMRALVYDRPSVCSVRDVPMPVCGEDEVVIKVMGQHLQRRRPPSSYNRSQVGTLSHHHRS